MGPPGQREERARATRAAAGKRGNGPLARWAGLRAEGEGREVVGRTRKRAGPRRGVRSGLGRGGLVGLGRLGLLSWAGGFGFTWSLGLGLFHSFLISISYSFLTPTLKTQTKLNSNKFGFNNLMHSSKLKDPA